MAENIGSGASQPGFQSKPLHTQASEQNLFFFFVIEQILAAAAATTEILFIIFGEIVRIKIYLAILYNKITSRLRKVEARVRS